MDARWWWIVGMIGPLAALALARGAFKWYAERRAPKLSFASQEEVAALEDVFRELMPKVFGFSFDDCFISDQSSLTDFTDKEEELLQLEERIRSLFEVDVSTLPDKRLVTIAKAIAAGNAQQ